MEDRIRLVGHSFAYKTGYKNGIDDTLNWLKEHLSEYISVSPYSTSASVDFEGLKEEFFNSRMHYDTKGK